MSNYTGRKLERGLLDKYRKQNIEEWQQSSFLSFSVVKTDWIEVSDEGIEGNLRVHQSEAKVNHANCESACDCYVVAVIASRSIKAAKYEIQKPSTCRSTLFRCKFWSIFRVFHLAWSTWPATKTFIAGWRNAARWLADLLEHEQSCCATSCEFDEKRATKPDFVAQSRPALYFSQQLSSTRNKCFLLRDKLITQGEKRETSTKTCNETMLRDKLRVFVFRISRPLDPQWWDSRIQRVSWPVYVSQLHQSILWINFKLFYC